MSLLTKFPTGAPGMSIQKLRSEPRLDDRLTAYLRQPLLQSGVVFLAVENVANLVAGLSQLLAGQRLLGVELEQVVADFRAERRRVLAGREAQHRLLDVHRQLATLHDPQTASVLRGRRVVGEL